MQRVSPWPIGIDEVDELLSDIRPLRVAVIGDVCLDVYLVLDPAAAEISVETGLPTRPVTEQRYSLGGAGNVAANLAALGCTQVRAFGVIGEDPFGAEIARILRRIGIDTGGVLTQGEEWDSCAYTKVLEAGKAGQESNRIDYGTFNRLRPDTADRLVARLAGALADGHADAVIVNQQVRHGVHTDRLRRSLRDLIRRHPDTPWVTDSRDFADDFTGAVRKLNEAEAVAAAGGALASGDRLRTAPAAARELFRRWQTPVFVTRGERGCLACDGGGVIELPAPNLPADLDPVGAGDAFLAGLGAALAAGREPGVAAAFAGLAAGVTVTKLHRTGTASAREIGELARRQIQYW